MTSVSIGTSPRRREDRRFVTGTGRFTSDLVFADMVYATFVRSTEAHGTIVGVDSSTIRSREDVIGVFTSADLGSHSILPPPLLDMPAMARPVLAADTVRFTGEPIVLVIATSASGAADAAEEVLVDIEPLSVVTDPAAAARGHILLFPEAGTNIAVRRSVDAAKASSRGPVHIEFEVRSQRVDPATMEPFSAVAVPEPDGTITLWCASGTPLMTRDGVLATLGLDPGDVEVRVVDVGGAFGQRGGFRQEYVAIVAAARRLSRPVKWVATRREQFVAGEHGRDLVHHVEIEAGEDGIIGSANIRILANLGAYPHRGWFIPITALQLAPGPYAIPEISVSVLGVVTNTAPTGPYRGAGRPEAGLAIERVFDAIADATGLEPDEVRRRNYVTHRAMPLTTATGLTHDGGDYAGLAKRAAELLEDRARVHHTRLSPGRRLGTGYASFVETTAGGHDRGEYARVEMSTSGVDVFTGSMSTGQGHETAWAQVVADVLGVPESSVTVVAGDTRRIPAGTGTFGSRSAPLGAVAVSRAAGEIKERLLRLAANMLEADPADLVLAAGLIGVRGVPGASVDLKDVVAEAIEQGDRLVAENTFIPTDQTLSSGCYGALVSVDLETGGCELLELVAVDDCGVQINPMIVAGQVHGGIAQGLGQALFEQIVYDEFGQPLTTTFLDYSIPGASSIPHITTDHRETRSPANPLGVKGVGEAGVIGAPPAIVAAVRAAIGPVGASELQLPLHPERVWRSAKNHAFGSTGAIREAVVPSSHQPESRRR